MAGGSAPRKMAGGNAPSRPKKKATASKGGIEIGTAMEQLNKTKKLAERAKMIVRPPSVTLCTQQNVMSSGAAGEAEKIQAFEHQRVLLAARRRRASTQKSRSPSLAQGRGTVGSQPSSVTQQPAKAGRPAAPSPISVSPAASTGQAAGAKGRRPSKIDEAVMELAAKATVLEQGRQNSFVNLWDEASDSRQIEKAKHLLESDQIPPTPPSAAANLLEEGGRLEDQLLSPPAKQKRRSSMGRHGNALEKIISEKADTWQEEQVLVVKKDGGGEDFVRNVFNSLKKGTGAKGEETTFAGRFKKFHGFAAEGKYEHREFDKLGSTEVDVLDIWPDGPEEVVQYWLAGWEDESSPPPLEWLNFLGLRGVVSSVNQVPIKRMTASQKRALGDKLRGKFGDLWVAATAGELDEWAETATGALALVILLDQFTRFIKAGSPEAYGQDDKAQIIAMNAISSRAYKELRPIERAVLFMPLVHAEDEAQQKIVSALFQALERESPSAYGGVFRVFVTSAGTHMEVVEEFGRFPHRNAALGRETTEEEEEFLLDAPEGFAPEEVFKGSKEFLPDVHLPTTPRPSRTYEHIIPDMPREGTLTAHQQLIRGSPVKHLLRDIAVADYQPATPGTPSFFRQ